MTTGERPAPLPNTTSTPLRVLHVTNEPFGLDMANGVQHVVYCLAHAQADAGHTVAVFTRDDRGVHVLNASAAPPTVTAGSGEVSRALLRDRVLARHFEPEMFQRVMDWQPQIVHFHSVHIPQNVALADRLRRAGVPYCVTVHAGLFRRALQRGWLKKVVFNRLFELRYLNEAAFIQALSPQEAESIRRRGIGCPVIVVPNAVPPGVGGPPSRPDALYADHPWLRERRVFMFIGRLDAWQKALDLLLQGFARARLGEAALVLVGPDVRGSRQQLARLADKLGIASRVLFREPAFGQERENVLAAADVFVHPSRWEGLSMSVLIASAAAKPCLITREADPLGELERAQAAIIVEPSVSSIAIGLQRAAALGRQELQEMGARARGVLEPRFTWRSVATTLVDAYRSALHQSARPPARGR